MIEVKIKNPEDKFEFEKAMKTFKKLVNRAGFIQEIRERRYYIKPSAKRRLDEKLRKRGKK